MVKPSARARDDRMAFRGRGESGLALALLDRLEMRRRMRSGVDLVRGANTKWRMKGRLGNLKREKARARK